MKSSRGTPDFYFPSTSAPVSTTHYFQLCGPALATALSPDQGWLSSLSSGTVDQNARTTSDKNNHNLCCKELLFDLDLFQ